jgi:hypothetical protein
MAAGIEEKMGEGGGDDDEEGKSEDEVRIGRGLGLQATS